jgi:hypothetical protein
LEQDVAMGSWLYIVLGVLLVLVGGVWTLQGLDVMGGSAMSGVTLWAVVGPIVLIVGLLVLWRGLRRRGA